MEFHTENKNEAFQQNQEGSPPLREWSEEFQCNTVNGILAPSPLSEMHMEMEVEPQAESSGTSPRKRQHSTPKEEHEHDPDCSHSAASISSSKKKRTRTTEGNEEFFFRLFKFLRAQGGHEEEYLLEMHEPKTSRVVDRSRLLVHEDTNGKWKIGTCDLAAGDHVVVPVAEDTSPPKFPKFSLQERLTGWTVERRKRGNGKEDKFYYHGGRQFRSFVEVTAFILYSTKLKDLKTITTAPQQQPQESNVSSTF